MSSCPFPIGFGGFFQTDPNTLYSGTTWEQKKDGFLLTEGYSYVGWEYVCKEGESFTLTEQTKVRYGITDKYYEKTLDAGTYTAENGLFGDPASGSYKHLDKAVYIDIKAESASAEIAMHFWIRTA